MFSRAIFQCLVGVHKVVCVNKVISQYRVGDHTVLYVNKATFQRARLFEEPSREKQPETTYSNVIGITNKLHHYVVAEPINPVRAHGITLQGRMIPNISRSVFTP